MTHGIGLSSSDLGSGQKTLRLFSLQVIEKALRPSPVAQPGFEGLTRSSVVLQRALGMAPYYSSLTKG